MKYAFVNGDKIEAVKGATGICPSCGSELIAKCGEININHWSHKGTRNCDIWWENETEWHRQWKNRFPAGWQEIVHFDGKGEKHIADIKTHKDWVLEFQHSFINSDERNSRNKFYSKLVWVINGLRRKTDKGQFQKVLEGSSRAPVGNVNIRKVNFPRESRLLNEWLNCSAPVFFDFCELNKSPLWFLLPLNLKEEAYLMSFSRKEFIAVHNDNGFDELVYKLIPNIQNIILEHKRDISNASVNDLINRHKQRVFRKRRF
ncbi:competence protein CoiA [Aquiflexum gelatinilyticum]|uniref:competence protein CoiA n=1 Tax=Aquiflexum gelatinilyticum TaxID=2961943 RepID=UPI002169A08A|nr:competence protein CoiA family protein [Aquiflexum gelatinilyticum]MCS4435877.1 competence protein CoiA family protein [Aquiflexum gelatinilyticum]